MEQPDFWYQIGTGMIYGLYDEPPETVALCERCITFGKDLAELNTFYVKVDALSSIWLDKTTIIQMKFFQMFDALLNLYPTFSNYWEKMANVVTNKALLAIFGLAPADVAGVQVSTISDTLVTVALEALLPDVVVEDRKE